jgi:hypothetical protein
MFAGFECVRTQGLLGKTGRGHLTQGVYGVLNSRVTKESETLERRKANGNSYY